MDQDNSWALDEGIPMYRVTVETTTSKTVIEVTDDLFTDTMAYKVLLPVITALSFMPSQVSEIADSLSEIAGTNEDAGIVKKYRKYLAGF